MLGKSSKWELDFVHYTMKFTIWRFECIIIPYDKLELFLDFSVMKF